MVAIAEKERVFLGEADIVTVVATRTYNPIFSSYGLIANNTITASATVETQ